jgi:hypothetical protein
VGPRVARVQSSSRRERLVRRKPAYSIFVCFWAALSAGICRRGLPSDWAHNEGCDPDLPGVASSRLALGRAG